MPMIDAFDDAERNAFAALGFDVTDIPTPTAHVEGNMSVNVIRHGHFHFRLKIILPNGSEIAGCFVPKTRILGGGGD